MADSRPPSGKGTATEDNGRMRVDQPTLSMVTLNDRRADREADPALVDGSGALSGDEDG